MLLRALTLVAVLAAAPAAYGERLVRDVPVEAGAPMRRVREVVLATNNPGKLEELRALLKGTGIKVLSLADAERRVRRSLPEVDETGHTYAENARLKAQTIADLTGIPALADDSGLNLVALGGFPGVKTKRWADDVAGTPVSDQVRNDMLLERVRAAGLRRPSAQWRTAIALAFPDMPALASVWEGVLRGYLAVAPRGGRGFGFDPLFVVKGQQGKTLGELSASAKARLGPRGRAIRQLVKELRRK